ncbi:hypothetical protein Pfo_013661 [Paulownia fortunei]|nr:hypothetical protein Pfo_013661 [Paulownia fortunei]
MTSFSLTEQLPMRPLSHNLVFSFDRAWVWWYFMWKYQSKMCNCIFVVVLSSHNAMPQCVFVNIFWRAYWSSLITLSTWTEVSFLFSPSSPGRKHSCYFKLNDSAKNNVVFQIKLERRLDKRWLKRFTT